MKDRWQWTKSKEIVQQIDNSVVHSVGTGRHADTEQRKRHSCHPFVSRTSTAHHCLTFGMQVFLSPPKLMLTIGDWNMSFPLQHAIRLNDVHHLVPEQHTRDHGTQPCSSQRALGTTTIMYYSRGWESSAATGWSNRSYACEAKKREEPPLLWYSLAAVDNVSRRHCDTQQRRLEMTTTAIG